MTFGGSFLTTRKDVQGRQSDCVLAPRGPAPPLAPLPGGTRSSACSRPQVHPRPRAEPVTGCYPSSGALSADEAEGRATPKITLSTTPALSKDSTAPSCRGSPRVCTVSSTPQPCLSPGLPTASLRAGGVIPERGVQQHVSHGPFTFDHGWQSHSGVAAASERLRCRESWRRVRGESRESMPSLQLCVGAI